MPAGRKMVVERLPLTMMVRSISTSFGDKQGWEGYKYAPRTILILSSHASAIFFGH
jgi:hypothetical protein